MFQNEGVRIGLASTKLSNLDPFHFPRLNYQIMQHVLIILSPWVKNHFIIRFLVHEEIVLTGFGARLDSYSISNLTFIELLIKSFTLDAPISLKKATI